MRGMIMKTDKECIDIMKQGAHELCDMALKKWMNPDFYSLDEEIRRQNANEWMATKNRISEMCSRFKKELKCRE
jgi:hypothetical protein